MISRRNIRVKVMQSLYTLSTREDDIKPGEPLKLLQKHLDESRELLEYLIYFITEVAAYSEKDSYKRSGKHLPSEADLNVNIKIAGNELLWKIKEDVSLKAAWAISKPQLRVDKNLVRKIYSELAASPEYQQYINAPSRSKTGEKEIVDFIFEELVLPNELFVAHIEETFTNWDDDSEMVVH
ncbi:MAG TPA: transcription antitermination factor NusB, partial [Flavisolibacter sp.]|nr:transcription antitermination factor NusB [Flavisolibacter sp.]